MKATALVLVLIVSAGCRPKGATVSAPAPPGERMGPTLVSPPPGPEGQAPVASSLKVVADDPGLLDGPTQLSFNIGSTRELLVRLQLPMVPSSLFWMTLTMQTPQGAFFVTKAVPFSSDPLVKQVHHPENPALKVDVTQVKTVPGGFTLDNYFLVGGTALQTQGSGGDWKLRASIDGVPGLAAEQTVHFVMSL